MRMRRCRSFRLNWLDYTTDVIAGRTIYFNDCLDGTDGCEPAVAISAEPHFVIIAPTDTELPRTCFGSAQAVIEQLDG